MGRQVAELLHKGTDFVLFAGIGNVGDIDENRNALALLFMEAADLQHLRPILIGQGESRRVIGRRIQDNQQGILLAQHIGYGRGKRLDIECAAFIEQGKRRKPAADFLAQAAVYAPAPVGCQDVVADFRIVGNGDVNGSGAAGRRYGVYISFGTICLERFVYRRLAVIRQADRRRVRNKISHRQGPIDFFYDGKTPQYFIFAGIAAYRGVDDALPAVCRHRRLSSLAELKHGVV